MKSSEKSLSESHSALCIRVYNHLGLWFSFWRLHSGWLDIWNLWACYRRSARKRRSASPRSGDSHRIWSRSLPGPKRTKARIWNTYKQMLVGRLMVKTDLCIVAHSSRQQGEGVFDSDSPLYNVLTQTFQAVLTIRRGQVQQPWRSRDTDSVGINN